MIDKTMSTVSTYAEILTKRFTVIQGQIKTLAQIQRQKQLRPVPTRNQTIAHLQTLKQQWIEQHYIRERHG